MDKEVEHGASLPTARLFATIWCVYGGGSLALAVYPLMASHVQWIVLIQ